jgi:hypothetical protein
MKKQILTGLGVLLFGASMAVASPQSYRGNFNDQPQYQTHRVEQRQQTQRYSRRAEQQRRRTTSRAKHRRNRNRRDNYNWRG